MTLIKAACLVSVRVVLLYLTHTVLDVYSGIAMAEYLFNVDNGYLEALVRGFRSGILSRADYINLVQCESVEGK